MTPRFSPLLLAALAATTAKAEEPTTSLLGCIVSRASGYAFYADGPFMQTDLEVASDRPLPTRVSVADGVIRLAPDQSTIIPRFGRNISGPRVGVAKVDATNAKVATFVNIDSPRSRRRGFQVPLLTHAIGSHIGTPSEVRLVANTVDRSLDTSLLLFNVGDVPAWITATIYDDALPGVTQREFIYTTPGRRLTWYDVKTPFATGRIELARGMRTTDGFCLTPADLTAEVYGFAAVGAANSDALRIRPVTPKLGLSFWLL